MDAFNAVKKFIIYEKVNIDSTLFKIHYRVTFALLVGASLISTGRQYFGDPIACKPDKDLSQKLIDQYCWTEAIFSVAGDTTTEAKNTHVYYQWVWLILLVQAFCFYLPHLFWKFFEAGRTEKMIGEIRGYCFDENIDEMVRKAADTFIQNPKSMSSANLANVYIFCEALNLANIFGQWFLIRKFFGRDLILVGIDMVKFVLNDNHKNPMLDIFPTVAKCKFQDYGLSGEIERLDVLCFLPINTLNGKLYTFFWLWFVFVQLVTIVGFIAIVIRVQILNRYHSLLCPHLNSVANPADYSNMMCQLNRTLDSSDFFILEMLTKNLSGANKLNFVRHIYTSMPTYTERNRHEKLCQMA